jgi:hypothetical protein
LQYRSDWPWLIVLLYVTRWMFVWLSCGFRVRYKSFYILSVFVGGKENGFSVQWYQNKLRTFVYNFNDNWENKYFFISVSNKCVCLICNASVAVSKKCNVEWHFMTVCEENIPTTAKYLEAKLRIWSVIYDCIKQYFLSILTKPKQLPLLHIKSQKYWLRRRRSPLKMVT